MIKFVTDRTGSDVLLGNKKGYYSYEDLNRVESAVYELSAEVGLRLDIKKDWKPGDLIMQSDMTRYLQNLYKIRDSFAKKDEEYTVKKLPDSMENLTWRSANDIEKMLEWAYTLREEQPGDKIGEFIIGISKIS